MRAFTELLAANGLAAGRLSRHRLRDVESGDSELPDALWDDIAAAMIASGRAAGDVAGLRMAGLPIEPVPVPTPRQRLERWTRAADQLSDNRWWRYPLTLVARATNPANMGQYRGILARHGVDRVRILHEARKRFERGAATAGQWQASPDDGVAVDRVHSVLAAEMTRGELFLLPVRLYNTGSVPWRDRLLYRIGPPVSSATPFTPPMLPVPDTDPGHACDMQIPGRAQWFLSNAVINMVMVFPDFSSCLPGHLPVWVDTREPELDHSLPLPPGFPEAPPAK
ncbi:hypothetical protein [Actinophytocola sp.]|uniref:hypothetical protein n=1 Tax=Actinophytocola sp. TaxID=1872138 RepID=UPI00389AE5BC